MVKNEYLQIRYWDNIRLWEDYRLDLDKFVDESFDFVYIFIHMMKIKRFTIIFT